MTLAPNLEEIFGKLKSLKIFDFYKSRKLTEEQELWLETLCQFYLVAPGPDRLKISGMVDRNISFLFHLYGKIAAIQAVSEANTEKVRLGLAALAIENGVFDWRDSLFVLVLLYNSARKIGMNPEQEVRLTTELASPQGAKFFTDFLARAPEDRTIAKFGFKEGTDSDGHFTYLAR